MGIDYYSCHYCDESFPDVIDYVWCECGIKWCCDECAEADGYKDESCSKGFDVDDNECEQSCWSCENHIDSNCKYCRQEDFDDSILLNFALKKLVLTREQLIEQYKIK
jgi:hypothetical protein